MIAEKAILDFLQTALQSGTHPDTIRDAFRNATEANHGNRAGTFCWCCGVGINRLESDHCWNCYQEHGERCSDPECRCKKPEKSDADVIDEIGGF